MRPFTVKTCLDCSPLFAILFPDIASTGGGKSGFRRTQFLLHSRFESGSPKFMQRPSNRFLGVGNQLSHTCRIHRLDDLLRNVIHFPLCKNLFNSSAEIFGNASIAENSLTWKSGPSNTTTHSYQICPEPPSELGTPGFFA